MNTFLRCFDERLRAIAKSFFSTYMDNDFIGNYQHHSVSFSLCKGMGNVADSIRYICGCFLFISGNLHCLFFIISGYYRKSSKRYMIINSANGDVEKGLIFCSTKVDQIKKNKR